MPKGIRLVQSESFPVLKLNLSEQLETSKEKRWVNITYFLLSLCLFLSSTLSLYAKKPLLWEPALVYLLDTFWNWDDRYFCYNNKQWTAQSSNNLIIWKIRILLFLWVFMCIYCPLLTQEWLLVKLQLYFSLSYNSLVRTSMPDILTKWSFSEWSETHCQ